MRAVCEVLLPPAIPSSRSGPREPQLGEEHARERVVVVLAGVHEHLLVALAQRAGDRRGLDELRPVADHGQDPHGALSLDGVPAANGYTCAPVASRSATIAEPPCDRARALAARSTTPTRRGRASSVFSASSANPAGRERPLLVYLRGRAGASRRRGPSRTGASPPWLERALADFRVLMLDQRGTGRSTPVGVHARRAAPRSRPTTSRTSAPTRSCATPRRSASRARGRALERARQSFGGFCALRYLSARARARCARCSSRAGVPPLGAPVDDVYRATFARMRRAQRALLRALPGRPRARPRAARAAGARTIRCPAGTVDARCASASSGTRSA